ncbi:MAG: aldo/keto reductase [Oscillospiraceae bacterium]|nr:aldo/keto reductase [Oscillospiraceae bacterium]
MPYSDLIIKDPEGNVKEILKVSKLCFGSLCMGPLQSNLSIKDGAKIINRAVELGINFIDTAQIYKTYSYIKSALDINVNKNKIIISTKTYAYTRKLAKEALEEALRELDREYIDIFMLHEQESVHTIYGHIEALEYFFEQKKAGRIKSVGISTHHVTGVLGAVEFNQTYKKDKLDIIHPMYNITGLGIIPVSVSDSDEDYQKSETSVLSQISQISQMETALIDAKKSGFFIFSMKPLGGGNLFARAEEALKFVLNKPFIDSIAVGMKSEIEVDSNANFFETGEFPEEYHKNYLKNAWGKHLHIDSWCEGCGKCVLACPSKALKLNSKGIAICDYNKCVLCGYCSGACDIFAIKII